MKKLLLFLTLLIFNFRDSSSVGLAFSEKNKIDYEDALSALEHIVEAIGGDQPHPRVKREEVRGVSNLDIRDAILQLLNVIRDGNTKFEKHEHREKQLGETLLQKLSSIGTTSGFEKKIDNISTFLLRMKSKMDSIERLVKKTRRGGGGGTDALETLARESYDILTLLPTYIENTKNAVTEMSKESGEKFKRMEYLLIDSGDDEDDPSKPRSIAKVLKNTESNILGASKELKDIVIESGHMAENLFERVNDGYHELTEEIKGLSNVEQVLLNTADAVIETKRKLEFGVQQIIFKVGELVKLSGGKLDEQLEELFQEVTEKIITNQNEALGNLTKKVEKEIGQVWRQMGIMYGQVSNSIKILEKVKEHTEIYVSKTGKNLGAMEGQVEGLTDRMVDVDSNLNYMLGQLSLVVQEFNQVKTGLGEAMSGLGEEIKEFKSLEDDEN